MADEQSLIEAGLLPGIDFCRQALSWSAVGRLPGTRHLRRCAVCLRRWRVTEAELQGWPAMAHVRAAAILPDMAASFALADRNEHYRPFYAHVARCASCEHRLAELTFDQRPSAAAARGGQLIGPPATR
jgi:hypothetical protein